MNNTNILPQKRKHSLHQQETVQISSDDDYVSFDSLQYDAKEYIYKQSKKASEDIPQEQGQIFGQNFNLLNHDDNQILHLDFQNVSDQNYELLLNHPKYSSPLIPSRKESSLPDGNNFTLNNKQEYTYKRKVSQCIQTQATQPTQKIQNKSLNSDILKILSKQNYTSSLNHQVYCKNESFPIQCQFHHKGVTNYQSLIESEQIHCLKCQSTLDNLYQYAEKNQGELLSRQLSESVTFKCNRDHIFNLKLNDYHQDKWCQKCKKILKQEFKDFLKEEEERIQQNYIKKQEQLYHNARKIYKKSFCTASSDSEDNIPEPQQNAEQIKQAEQVVEKRLEKIAHKKAVNFLKQNPQISQEEEHSIQEVFKVLLFPKEILLCYFQALELQDLKQAYKKFARIIHPDKNQHPQAQDAFSKINELYHQCLSQKEI